MNEHETKTAALVNRFAELAASRGESLRASDSDKANECFDQLVTLVRTADSSVGRSCFVPLLKSPNIDVRVAAGSVVLSTATSEAVAVLEDAAAQRAGAASMSATMVLTQWRRGIPPFP